MAHAGIANKAQRPTGDRERIVAAAQEAYELLKDGQWHSKAPIDKICHRHKANTLAVLDELLCATSDSQVKGYSGRTAYVCIPGPDTPELAPGETDTIPNVLEAV